MTLRIKNWSKLQHFKDRTPPWIKLYREILDDPDWHELDGETAKVLIGLWLIASEDELHNGGLPSVRKLAFRLRMKESQLNQALTKLEHWLIQDDIKLISGEYHSDAPETEESREETEKPAADKPAVIPPGFAEFWETWPANDRRQAKGKCLDAWKKAGAEREFELVIAHVQHLKSSDDWQKQNGQYVPAPLVYINGRKWDGVYIPERRNSGIMAGAI